MLNPVRLLSLKPFSHAECSSELFCVREHECLNLSGQVLNGCYQLMSAVSTIEIILEGGNCAAFTVHMA